jgi:hypothetical protein
MRVAGAVAFKDARESTNEEEGTQGVALCNTFMESVRSDAAHSEGGRGIGSKMYAGRHVIEKTEPRSEERAVQELNCFPQIFAKDVVECFL